VAGQPALEAELKTHSPERSWSFEMERITVEPIVEQVLAKFGGNILLCDSQGRAIGIFSPFRDRPQANDLQLEPPHSVAETEELLRTQRSGKPLEEILKRLRL
jgi:hypothetical protein